MEKCILECMTLVGSAPPPYIGERTYVSTGALDRDHIDYGATEQVSYESRPSRANLVAQAGDILFAKMCATRKTLQLDDTTKEHLFSTGFFAVRANNCIIIPELLYYILDSDQFLSQKDKYSSGATQKAITNAGLEKIFVQIPPLSEQPRIASLLDTLTSLISLRKQQLAKLDELVKARFVEMFGDPVQNTKRFPAKPLSALGVLDRGRSKHRPRNAPELLGGPYPLIQTGEVANAGLYITEYQNTYSETGLQQSKMWKAGTLCITIAANIAQTAILAFDACFPDSVVGFIQHDDVTAIYIHYWFGFFQRILEEQAPQVAQKNINLQILSDLKVMVPPMEDQLIFSSFIDRVEKSKATIQQGLDKLELLKKSLMQQYFGEK